MCIMSKPGISLQETLHMHNLRPELEELLWCPDFGLCYGRSQSSPEQGYLPAPGLNAGNEVLRGTSQQWLVTHRDLSRMTVGHRQLWRERKFVDQTLRQRQKCMIMETQAEQQRFWDLSQKRGEGCCPQSCRSACAAHRRAHVPHVATSQVSPRCLPAADVPPLIMDSRQIGFLYWAGGINSTQCCPAILWNTFQLYSISTNGIDSAGNTNLWTISEQLHVAAEHLRLAAVVYSRFRGMLRKAQQAAKEGNCNSMCFLIKKNPTSWGQASWVRICSGWFTNPVLANLRKMPSMENWKACMEIAHDLVSQPLFRFPLFHYCME